MVQAFLPGMREQRSGVIVNVSSIAGRVSAPLGGMYSASKYALEALSEALHYEVGHFGVRIALVEPGGFDTSFGDNRLIYGVDDAPYDELDEEWEQAQGRLQGVPGTRPGPEVVAQMIGDAVDGTEQKLRWPVGDDANLILSVRTSMNDEQFEATMRETLQLTW
jgi:NAD(P)-dependent dehydrogenase (short-subunit alcohol dehydrogenase family)